MMRSRSASGVILAALSIINSTAVMRTGTALRPLLLAAGSSNQDPARLPPSLLQGAAHALRLRGGDPGGTCTK